MLYVVMPVYNEERALPDIFQEWIPMLRATVGEFRLLAIDDGSRDESLSVLNQLATQYTELEVVHKNNTGHGQSCIFGYRLALDRGAEWVFQLDSDGQCDPRYFESFWNLRARNRAIFGVRASRDDGSFRLFASKVLSVVVYLSSGVWVKDSNVPYRLMRADALAALIDRVPKDFHLANILLSVLLQRDFGVLWLPIHFRERRYGVSSAPLRTFASRGLQLYQQLASALSNERPVVGAILTQPALPSKQS